MIALREKLYYYLEISTDEPIDVFLAILIILNVAAVIVSTVDSIYVKFRPLFDGFELFSVMVFTIEYVLRLWVCTVNENYRHPLWGRLRYAV